jgi:hypothetical protein
MECFPGKIREYSQSAALKLIMILAGALLWGATAQAFDVTVINNGNADGNINGDVVCTISANGGSCFQSGLTGSILLTAVPVWNAVFAGWGPPCSTTGSCTLSETTTVEAKFNLNYKAIIVGGHSILPNFATLTDACNVAKDQGTVAADYNYTFYEDLNLVDYKSIRLYLGKDPGFYYSAAIGFTTLRGSLTVQAGSVEIDSLIIE